jgi:membrane protease subunit (stomatin/prohibitin family)
MGLGAGMAQIIAQGMQGGQSPSGGTATQPSPAQPGAAPTSAASTITCYNCQAQIPSNSKFCPECGANQAAKTCSNCQAQNLPNAKFCTNCGNKLE